MVLVKGSLSAAKDANLQKEDFHLHHKHIGMEKSHSSSPAQKSQEKWLCEDPMLLCPSDLPYGHLFPWGQRTSVWG